MSLSVSLLVLAVLVAVIPLVATRVRPPQTFRDLEIGFVFGSLTLLIGTIAVHLLHPLGIFAIFHLLYLLIVVTVPVVLIAWWLLGRFRGYERRWTQIAGIVGVVIALSGLWGTHIEPNWLDTDQVVLGSAVDTPLRIGVIADVQTPNVGKHEQNAIDTIIAREPDLVLIPGDLFQGSPAQIDAARPDFVRLLRQLTDAVPVVAVVSGDSDSPDAVSSMAADAGALFIDNTVVDIVVAGQPVRLAGVSVQSSPARLTTLAGLGAAEPFTILLSHRPDAVYQLPAGSDVDLVVAGHTHGGQIAFPFFGPPVTFTDVPRDIAAGGLGIVNNFPLYVSAGVGLERHQAPQVRFGVRPEVGIIEVLPNA